MSEKDIKLVKIYAKLHDSNVSEITRKTILEKIEDSFDILSYEKFFTEHEQNPKIYTFEEAKVLLLND
jgi:hypothetical protein